MVPAARLVVSYFNSTSNHNRYIEQIYAHFVVSYFNSTSNHNRILESFRLPPVVSYFNSTSNHNTRFSGIPHRTVVSYFNSTSNHNWPRANTLFRCVVSYFNSTSNHNRFALAHFPNALFLISILHQTTTVSGVKRIIFLLFLISILHQTTTSDMRFVDCHSVMWPNERYERRMTGRGSRNDAGFVFQRYFSLKVECTSRARNRYMFAK